MFKINNLVYLSFLVFSLAGTQKVLASKLPSAAVPYATKLWKQKKTWEYVSHRAYP